MPRIDNQSLDCVVYLYSSTDDALRGADPQGTGFIVGYPTPHPHLSYYHHCYIVTNAHVAKVAPVARAKKDDAGRIAMFGSDVTDWELNEAADIAILRIDADVHALAASFSRPEYFLSISHLNERNVGLGDDVFMIGLLVDHPEELPNNHPYARFGHISKMCSMANPYEKKGGFYVDMRSRVGFSGSPVLYIEIPTPICTCG